MAETVTASYSVRLNSNKVGWEDTFHKSMWTHHTVVNQAKAWLMGYFLSARAAAELVHFATEWSPLKAEALLSLWMVPEHIDSDDIKPFVIDDGIEAFVSTCMRELELVALPDQDAALFEAAAKHLGSFALAEGVVWVNRRAMWRARLEYVGIEEFFYGDVVERFFELTKYFASLSQYETDVVAHAVQHNNHTKKLTDKQNATPIYKPPHLEDTNLAVDHFRRQRFGRSRSDASITSTPRGNDINFGLASEMYSLILSELQDKSEISGGDLWKLVQGAFSVTFHLKPPIHPADMKLYVSGSKGNSAWKALAGGFDADVLNQKDISGVVKQIKRTSDDWAIKFFPPRGHGKRNYADRLLADLQNMYFGGVSLPLDGFQEMMTAAISRVRAHTTNSFKRLVEVWDLEREMPGTDAVASDLIDRYLGMLDRKDNLRVALPERTASEAMAFLAELGDRATIEARRESLALGNASNCDPLLLSLLADEVELTEQGFRKELKRRAALDKIARTKMPAFQMCSLLRHPTPTIFGTGNWPALYDGCGDTRNATGLMRERCLLIWDGVTFVHLPIALVSARVRRDFPDADPMGRHVPVPRADFLGRLNAQMGLNLPSDQFEHQAKVGTGNLSVMPRDRNGTKLWRASLAIKMTPTRVSRVERNGDLSNVSGVRIAGVDLGLRSPATMSVWELTRLDDSDNNLPKDILPSASYVFDINGRPCRRVFPTGSTRPQEVFARLIGDVTDIGANRGNPDPQREMPIRLIVGKVAKQLKWTIDVRNLDIGHVLLDYLRCTRVELNEQAKLVRVLRALENSDQSPSEDGPAALLCLWRAASNREDGLVGRVWQTYFHDSLNSLSVAPLPLWIGRRDNDLAKQAQGLFPSVLSGVAATDIDNIRRIVNLNDVTVSHLVRLAAQMVFGGRVTQEDLRFVFGLSDGTQTDSRNSRLEHWLKRGLYIHAPSLGLSLQKLLVLDDLLSLLKSHHYRVKPNGSQEKPQEGYRKALLDKRARVRDQLGKVWASQIVGAAIRMNVDMLILEDLTDYKPSLARTKQENRMLRLWGKAKLVERIQAACQMHGIICHAINARGTSQYHWLNGEPGFRCEIVAAGDLCDSTHRNRGFWLKDVDRAREHLRKSEKNNKPLSVLDRATLDCADWLKTNCVLSATKVLRPCSGGTFFSTVWGPQFTETSTGIGVLNADANASRNIAIRGCRYHFGVKGKDEDAMGEGDVAA